MRYSIESPSVTVVQVYTPLYRPFARARQLRLEPCSHLLSRLNGSATPCPFSIAVIPLHLAYNPARHSAIRPSTPTRVNLVRVLPAFVVAVALFGLCAPPHRAYSHEIVALLHVRSSLLDSAVSFPSAFSSNRFSRTPFVLLHEPGLLTLDPNETPRDNGILCL